SSRPLPRSPGRPPAPSPSGRCGRSAPPPSTGGQRCRSSPRTGRPVC
ncbi:hypothetical protein LLOABG_LLOABG_05645, partial [Dysosmobacter welbionis]